MYKKTLNKTYLLLTYLFMFLLASCDKSDHYQKLNSDVTLLKKTTFAATKNIPPPTILRPQPVTYQAAPLREPFEIKEEHPLIKQNSTNPLLTYPLSVLKFKGTLYKNHEIFAFILAPDNKLYRVKTGDKVGDRLGRVSRILKNQILIIETSTEIEKPTKKRVIKLELNGNQG